jgi:hypothetical protein
MTNRRAPRSALLIVAALAVALFGGAALGLGLAQLMAPRSILADIVSFFVFPLAFALGWQAWIGLAIALSLPRLFRRLRRPEEPAVEPEEVRAPVDALPGAGIFVPIATGMGLAAGVLVGLVSTWPLQAVLVAYTLSGLGYGLVLWGLANAGFLLWPEE